MLNTVIVSIMPYWEVLKNHLYREGRLSKEHCKRILKDTLGLISKSMEYRVKLVF